MQKKIYLFLFEIVLCAMDHVRIKIFIKVT